MYQDSQLHFESDPFRRDCVRAGYEARLLIDHYNCHLAAGVLQFLEFLSDWQTVRRQTVRLLGRLLEGGPPEAGSHVRLVLGLDHCHPLPFKLQN